MKEQLLSGLPESHLEVVVADKMNPSIIWLEEKKEFILDGQLYDVAKIKKVNGKILLYCLNDKKEERLLQDLSKAVKSGNDNDNDKGNKHTIKFQLSDFFWDNAENKTRPNRSGLLKHIDFAVAICSSIKEVKLPPPRA